MPQVRYTKVSSRWVLGSASLPSPCDIWSLPAPALPAVEGYAFLFSRKGASVIAAAEIVLLFRTAGGGRVLGVAGKAAAACVAGRFLYSLFHTVKAEATGGDSKQQDILKSIWDWKPPVGDSMSSGAWLVLRELVLTANSMAGSHYYPEVTSLMASPELQPVELATRLYYLYMEHERTPAHSSDKDWGSNAVPVPDEVLKLVRDYRHFACYAYDFTDDVALAQGLKTDGEKLCWLGIS